DILGDLGRITTHEHGVKVDRSIEALARRFALNRFILAITLRVASFIAAVLVSFTVPGTATSPAALALRNLHLLTFALNLLQGHVRPHQYTLSVDHDTAVVARHQP